MIVSDDLVEDISVLVELRTFAGLVFVEITLCQNSEEIGQKQIITPFHTQTFPILGDLDRFVMAIRKPKLAGVIECDHRNERTDPRSQLCACLQVSEKLF